MKKLFMLFALMISVAGTTLQAQRDCGSVEYLQQQILENPSLIQQMDRIEQHTRRYEESGGHQRVVVTIPVVVNVVYRGEQENISDAQILTQIAVLNQDFRRTNTDADGIWSQAADTEIQFCLATVDPSGNPTTGIRRRSTTVGSFSSNNNVKFNSTGGIDAWPAGQYLNIWVCNLSGGLLGYAQFPGGNAATDGIVCDYAYFGTIGTATQPFHLGRTATHEVGHWLNLRHIWGDGGCGVDDLVEDTPLAGAPNTTGTPCTFPGPNTCNTGAGDLPDMFQNYMDYSDDACMNLFTAGQKARMQAVLAPGGFRNSLLTSPGCGGDTGGGGDPDPTCDDEIQNGLETGVDCGGPDCPPCVVLDCGEPTGLKSTPAFRNKGAKLQWNPVADALNYTAEIRQIAPSAGPTTSFITNNTFWNINGLTQGNTYEWKVRANCGGANSSDFVTATFVAGQSGRSGAPVGAMELYPNPVNDLLQVQIHTSSAPDQIGTQAAPAVQWLIVTGVGGGTLKKIRVTEDQEAAEIDVKDLPAGLYFLRLTDAGGRQLGTARFVVSRKS